MGIAHLLTGLFALYRMTRRELKTVGKKGSVSPTAIHTTSSSFEGMQQHAIEEASDNMTAEVDKQ